MSTANPLASVLSASSNAAEDEVCVWGGCSNYPEAYCTIVASLPRPVKGLSDSQSGPSHLEPDLHREEESELQGQRRVLPASDEGSYRETKEEGNLTF